MDLRKNKQTVTNPWGGKSAWIMGSVCKEGKAQKTRVNKILCEGKGFRVRVLDVRITHSTMSTLVSFQPSAS